MKLYTAEGKETNYCLEHGLADTHEGGRDSGANGSAQELRESQQAAGEDEGDKHGNESIFCKEQLKSWSIMCELRFTSEGI